MTDTTDAALDALIYGLQWSRENAAGDTLDSSEIGILLDAITALRQQIAEAEARGRIAGMKEAAAIAIAHDYTIQSSTAADCRAAQIAAAIRSLIGDAT